MPNYYSLISDKLNLNMEYSEFYLDDSGITPPNFYYEGCDMSLKEDPFAVWNQHSVFVHNNKHIVKYSEDTFLDLLLENEDGSTSLLDSRVCTVIDIDEDRVVDIHPSNQYYIEDYDLEKSVKRKYKVILEETSEMNEFDHQYFANIILNENNQGVIRKE